MNLENEPCGHAAAVIENNKLQALVECDCYLRGKAIKCTLFNSFLSLASKKLGMWAPHKLT